NPCATNAANSAVQQSGSPPSLCPHIAAPCGRSALGSTPGPASGTSLSGCIARASTCSSHEMTKRKVEQQGGYGGDCMALVYFDDLKEGSIHWGSECLVDKDDPSLREEAASEGSGRNREVREATRGGIPISPRQRSRGARQRPVARA